MCVSKGTWRRAFMNLRCAICCLNAESPTESVMDRSACSLWHSTHIHACNLSFPSPRVLLRCLLSLCRFSFLASPSPATLPRLVNLDPGSAVKRRRDGRVQKEKSEREGEKPGGKEGKGKDKVEISRRHHSLPPRRLFVSPPSLWPYKTAFHPHSWRRHTVARPAENRVELSASRFTRSHFNRIARTGEEKKRRNERQGRKQDAFFGRTPDPPALLSRRQEAPRR